jgi:hypothetical protein
MSRAARVTPESIAPVRSDTRVIRFLRHTLVLRDIAQLARVHPGR